MLFAAVRKRPRHIRQLFAAVNQRLAQCDYEPLPRGQRLRVECNLVANVKPASDHVVNCGKVACDELEDVLDRGDPGLRMRSKTPVKTADSGVPRLGERTKTRQIPHGD